jgi:hypothetical protein
LMGEGLATTTPGATPFLHLAELFPTTQFTLIAKAWPLHNPFNLISVLIHQANILFALIVVTTRHRHWSETLACGLGRVGTYF